MNARKRDLVVAGALILAGCGGLPGSLRDEIASEHTRLQQAERQVQHTRESVQEDLAKKPDLFRGAPVAEEWPQRLKTAQAELDHARSDDRELAKLTQARDDDARRRAMRLIADERGLREKALRDSEALDFEAAKWLDFESNTPHYLAKMQREYDTLRGADLTPITQIVQKAGQDWPAKKAELETRLNVLQKSSDAAVEQWNSAESARQEAAAGNADGAAIATLIRTDEALERDSAALTSGVSQLRAQSGQLYDAWDKILTDLDKSRSGPDTVYREKLKTVRTHFVDVEAKKTEVSSDEGWVDIPAGTYRSLENDLGMAVAHKDAGLFDSEARGTAQPPGFAYVATPEQGSNQYGYWSHAGGQSVWTFLPEYFLMRQLLWGPSYRPIYVNEFNGYQQAQRFGRSYYGNETPASPPKYGTHGTFTGERYAGSRYVQSGGFKGSGYAARSAESPRPSTGFSAPESRPGPGAGESSAGKRFGGGPSPSGRRFGPSGGSRMPGRSFGRRR